jgi:soluble lytic murein transglycosylase-like protein
VADCYSQAAARYGVPDKLLRAIARVESGTLNAATAENENKDGTRDIGRMQINTRWLGALKQFGITEDSLRNECTSIQVGAWILADNVNRLGLSWDAVGAYNVGCRKLDKQECERRRNLYAWKVFRAIKPNDQIVKEEAVEMQQPKANESRIAMVTF